MLNKVRRFIELNKMFDGCDRIIAGLSGGADSVCLLILLKELVPKNIAITAVHINHGIRGEEALRDEKFCEDLCRRMNVEYRCFKYDVRSYAKEKHLTVEEAGRTLRYETFDNLAGIRGRIAVAHHKNDRAETVLFNICRGSGLKGASGIQPIRDNIIRPLLCVTRQEIEHYLTGKEFSWCEDYTNSSNDYARNCIRNQIIPIIEESVNSAVVDNIDNFANNAMEAERYLSEITDKLYRERVSYTRGKILIKRLEELDDYMLKRIIRKAFHETCESLKDLGMVHVEAVKDVYNSDVGSVAHIKSGIMVEHTREGLLFYKDGAIREPSFAKVQVPGEIELPNGIGKFEFSIISPMEPEKIPKEVYTKYFDYDKIKFGLQLRGWQSGDYITIDNENHHKKIKQYFADEKMSVTDKTETILLADGSEIVWVVGKRIGNRYKVSESTKRILKVVYGGEA